jgi:predicted  nucleic acid-binding Zn-ribbon protein
MHDSLKALLKLQELDTEMIFLKEAKRRRPQELESDRRRLDEKKRVVDAIVAEMKKLRMESDRREVDLKKNDAEVNKLQVALNQAKSNQEYTILKEQIARLQEQNGKTEEEILKRLGDIDGFEKAKKEAEADLKAFGVEFRAKEDELHSILKGIDEQIGDLSQKRDEAAHAVPADHLQIYERVLARHRDIALARIENSVCQGCFMSVTSQKINEIMIGRELIQCGNCLRILYLG